MTKISLAPSGVSVHFQKHKANSKDINGLQRHNERTPGKGRHSNENIKSEKTKNNVFLIDDDRTLYTRVADRIEQGRTVGRGKGLKGVRKDAVRMYEITVQPSGKVWELPEEDQVEMLKDAFEYFKAEFGAENVVSAVIHVDETHPHLHMDFVPLKDGRLDAKHIVTPTRLKKLQDDFLTHWQERYPDMLFQRGSGDHAGLTKKAYVALEEAKKAAEKEVEARETDLDSWQDDLEAQEATQADRETQLAAKEKKSLKQLSQARTEVGNLYAQKKKLNAEVNSLYQQKKALRDEYAAQWGEHKAYMAQLRDEHEKTWRDPDACEKWDRAALRLKRAKELQYDAYGSSGALGACIRLFGMIRQYSAQRQLEELEKQKKAALDDVTKRQQAEREKWAQEKAQHKSELEKIKKDISTSTKARNAVQAQVQDAQKALKSAQAGLLPYQKKAASALENAKFWNQQSKRKLSAYDMTRVKNAVKTSDKEISLSLEGLKGLKDDSLQL